MNEELVCEQCGKNFTLPASVRERYPNWTPRQCMRCRDAKGSSRGRGGSGGAKAGSRTGTAPGGLLTTKEVLAKYSGGPSEGVFTDGSCQGNPGPGGWGAVWVEDGDIVAEKYGYAPSTTNNRMELTAIIEGLRMLPVDSQITLYTDSRLVVDTLNKWAAGWEARGWKRKDGEVKNLDLVQEAYRLKNERPGVHIEWIRAHDGSRWNEYADALSTAHLRGEA